MIDIRSTLEEMIGHGASDIFVEAGLPLAYKADGKPALLNDIRLCAEDTKAFVDGLYLLADNRSEKRLQEHGDDDFSFPIEGVARFRVSAFRQRGTLSAVIRVIRFVLPTPEELRIPPEIMELAHLPSGLVLVTGPAGSGKTTTLSCLVEEINHTEAKHIITLEDPIEFLHHHDKSIVSQREILTDTDTYYTGLSSAMRQSPDVILIGELTGSELIALAMKAAEGGRLILSSLHTADAESTMERLVGSFSPDRQAQAAMQLSDVLKAVVSQSLKEGADGRLMPEFSLTMADAALKEQIRARWN